MLTKKAFMKGMALLSAAFPEHETKDETVKLYREMLKGLTNQEFEAAVLGHISRRNYFPKVAELLGEVRALRPSAIEAWNKLIEFAEDNPVSGVPPMDEPTRRALDALGGYEKLKHTTYDELNHRFRMFREVYESEGKKADLLRIGEGKKQKLIGGIENERDSDT